ncbi:MFS transporter [Neobacillus sp. 114]|uniref:MFS transporter n=1 Tax=Neobacillus sp. 114 TaxID=3048535 RepID=UPI0024C42E3E|nr:MFS transporter [Neobacillus sp. 114]
MSEVGNQEKLSPQGRKAFLGAYFSFTVDMFDVYLPIVALTPAMIYFQPSTLSPTIATTLFYLVFILSMLGRPVGSFIFGNLADKIGRKRTNQTSLAGVALCTLFMALLPGYSIWGLWGITILAILRFVSGIFMGGVYTSANTLAMEYSPHNKRGPLGGFINSGAPTGNLLISLITSALLVTMSSSSDSIYTVWGWRIPFLIGAFLTFVMYIYYSRKVDESKVWKESVNKNSSPLKELFKGDNFKQLLQVLILMTGIWFTVNGLTSALPGILKILGVNSLDISNAQLLASLFSIPAYLLAGLISQKIGRKPTISILGIITFTIVPILYFWMLKSGFQNTITLNILVVLVTVLSQSVFGVLTAYITERFHTGVRASGYGIGYSFGIIIPAFSPFYMLGLSAFMPYIYTPVVLIVISGILITIAALIGPETKDVVFNSSNNNSIQEADGTGADLGASWN